MSRRCCCIECPDPVTDDFERSNSLNIGASWAEEVGDWDIFDGTLRADTTADAAAIYQTTPGGDKISFHVTGTTGPEAENDIFRVIVNWTNSGSYLYGEWKVGAGGYISLNSAGGGEIDRIDTAIDPDEGGGMTITVCLTEKIFYVSLSGRAELELWTTTSPAIAGGYLAGLGADSTASRFDEFAWNEHYETNNSCPACVCYCQGEPLPMELDITLNLYGSSRLIDCIDGASVTLVYQQGLGEWSGTLVASGAGCTECSELGEDYWNNLTMSCTGSNPHHPYGGFLLTADDAGSLFDDEADMANNGNSEGNTCDPLELIWTGLVGPQCEGDPPDQIAYKYTVTL